MSYAKIYVVFFLIVLLAPGTGLGQDQSESDLAKKAQNPIANMISLPFQNNTNFGIGPDNDEVQNVLNIQPVIPFTINDNWNLITRTIVPIISQPDFFTGGDGRITGLGDITFSAFFSPKDSAKLTWGVGPIFLFPTATDGPLGGTSEDGGESLGSGQVGRWSFGGAVGNAGKVGCWIVVQQRLVFCRIR